jgi:DNA-binding NarL/FixJ family response regulator
MTPRILIADDHEIVREGVRTLIARSRPSWEVCGEVGNGRMVVEAVESLKPDIVILDISMPGLSGLEVASRLTELKLDCRIVIFTMFDSDTLDREIRDSGAHGYVLKSEASRNLMTAIETVLSGGTFYGAPAMPLRAKDKPNPGIAFSWTPVLA